jgi:hypothetical protein
LHQNCTDRREMLKRAATQRRGLVPRCIRLHRQDEKEERPLLDSNGVGDLPAAAPTPQLSTDQVKTGDYSEFMCWKTAPRTPLFMPLAPKRHSTIRIRHWNAAHAAPAILVQPPNLGRNSDDDAAPKLNRAGRPVKKNGVVAHHGPNASRRPAWELILAAASASSSAPSCIVAGNLSGHRRSRSTR